MKFEFINERYFSIKLTFDKLKFPVYFTPRYLSLELLFCKSILKFPKKNLGSVTWSQIHNGDMDKKKVNVPCSPSKINRKKSCLRISFILRKLYFPGSETNIIHILNNFLILLWTYIIFSTSSLSNLASTFEFIFHFLRWNVVFFFPSISGPKRVYKRVKLDDEQPTLICKWRNRRSVRPAQVVAPGHAIKIIAV